MFGQAFAIVGTQVYSDPPYYHRGNGFALGAAVLGICASLGLCLLLHKLNTQKRQNPDLATAARQRTLGLEDICDGHPDFFYQLYLRTFMREPKLSTSTIRGVVFRKIS
jgi:hypothetical protein